MTRNELIDQTAASVKVQVAKAALALPQVVVEGDELERALSAYRGAAIRLRDAKAAWLALIAPADGWAPDPFKNKYPEGFE